MNRLGFKIFFVLLIFLAILVSPLLHCQELPSAPTPKLEIGLELTASAAAMVADAYTTHRIIAEGGVENNPLARPFVHSPAAQTGLIVAGLAGEGYLLYRLRRHPVVRRLVFAGIFATEVGFAVHNKVALIRHGD
jgi:hypothetical protein